MKVVVLGRNFDGEKNGLFDLFRSTGLEVEDQSGLNLGAGSPEQDVIKAVGDADIVIAGVEPYSRQVLEQCPNLKMISRRGIGYDAIDIEACKEKKIVVARTLGMVEGAVAEHVMAYILWFAKELNMQNEWMHQGKWVREMVPGAKTRTLGLVGFGGIGKEIAKRAVPFGMKVVYSCRHPHKEWEDEYQVSYRSMDELLAESDYVSVNVPLTDATRGMFGAETFAKMKDGSVFINIARGPVVDVMALRDELQKGRIRGAGIDVYDTEPCTDSPLLDCPTAVLTPHTAPFTKENFVEMNRMAAQNVVDYVKGNLDVRMVVEGTFGNV